LRHQVGGGSVHGRQAAFARVKKDNNNPETQSSSPPARPPKPPVAAAGIGDSGGENSMKADYGCHEALWKLSKRYDESDIHGAHLALVEQEKLLRDHIGFPSYKFQLAMTMASRSDIVFHLGDAQAASSIMAEALSVMAEAICPEKPMAARPGLPTPEFVLKLIRGQDKRSNVKWRHSDHAA
jgi:hypothetical protein